MRLLLEYGADPNTADGTGNTALAKASIYGNAGTVKLLLEHGADPDIRNNKGQTVFDILKSWYPDKYDKLMEILSRVQEKRLKKEDKAGIAATGYEFDI